MVNSRYMKAFLPVHTIPIFFLWWVSVSGSGAQPKPGLFHGNPSTLEPIDIRQWVYFYEDKSGDTLPLSVI